MRGLNLATADLEHETRSTPLIDFLRGEYVQLCTYMGDVEFCNLARASIAGNLSRQHNTRWLSNGLPAFIAQSTRWNSRAELPEFAALEHAFHRAFDAADLKAITMVELDAAKTESFPALRFNLHPSVSTLQFTTNVCSIWSALKCGEAPPHVRRLAEPQTILVWRQGGNSRFRILGSEEAMILAALHEGSSFAALSQMTFATAPEESDLQAERYLRGWIEAEIMLPPEVRP